MNFLNAILLISHIACFSIYTVRTQAVMGIDLGGEFIKVSVVTMSKPGETVLDRDSKRKTASIIGIKNGHLVFGESAKSLYRRNPESVAKNIDILLGRRFSDPVVVEYIERNPRLNLTGDYDDGVLINFPNSPPFTPVELFAAWLNEIRAYTKSFLGHEIADALLVVDPAVDYARLEAIKAAAKISSVNLMQITDSSRTVVTQFVVNRKKFLNETKTNVMFLDVGSTNTVATVARVAVEAGSKNSSVPSFNISGIGFSAFGAGGYDTCISDSLMKEFQEKHNINKDLRKDHKVNFKFQQEASNVKRVLTASKETRATVEDAYEFQTFAVKFPRTRMESQCSHVSEGIAKAVDRALDSSKLNAGDLEDVVLMGGGSLIPIIQEIIQRKTGRSSSRVLNTDESNAVGGSLLAAKAHKLFRVAEIKTPEVVYYPIEIEYTVTVNTSVNEQETKNVREMLFSHISKHASKRLLSIKNVSDNFEIKVRYADFPAHVYSTVANYNDLLLIKIKGVKETIAENPSYIPRSVAVHFQFDSLRTLNVVKAVMLLERNHSGIFDKMGSVVRNFFGRKPNSTDQDDNYTDYEVSDKSAELDNNTDTNATTPDFSKPKSDLNITVSLEVIVTPLYFRPYSEQSLNESFLKLEAIYQSERIKNENAKARNDLESFIFDTEKALGTGEWAHYAREEELESLTNVTADVKEWYEREGHIANASTSRSMHLQISSSLSLIKTRITEEYERETALSIFFDLLNRTQTLLVHSMSQKSILEYLNKTIISSVFNKSMETQNWVDGKVKEQSLLKPYDPPALTLTALRKRIRELEEQGDIFYRHFQEAALKAKREVPKVNTTNADSDQETSSTAPPSADIGDSAVSNHTEAELDSDSPTDSSHAAEQLEDL